MKQCKSREASDYYFDLLGEIQSVLATAYYKEEIHLSDYLEHFVNEFDNIPFYKEYLFKKIRTGGFDLID